MEEKHAKIVGVGLALGFFYVISWVFAQIMNWVVVKFFWEQNMSRVSQVSLFIVVTIFVVASVILSLRVYYVWMRRSRE